MYIRVGGRAYDKYNLECQPAAIRDEPPPLDVLEANGINESREKAGAAAEKLEYRDALCALGKGEELD